MEKQYNPQEIEKTWYPHWEKSGFFSPSGEGSPYTIVIPPPNVTGTLHMGHGFQLSLMDALIRYHRMRGFNTLWQVGTDHAGIATQMVVERQLQAQNQTRHEIGREAFLEKIWDWKKESGQIITQQMRRLGVSVDWSRERFTMDDDFNKAVIEIFIALYREGLIYRGKRLVNWDPKLHTAISDLEVISSEETGEMVYIKYPLTDGVNTVVIATTRPETLLGDAAVAVHPDDPRYQLLIGKTIKLPLVDREIPIIADEYVDPAFGTGCVKITPAHDFNDYAVGKRHHLPLINIFTPDATLNDSVPAAYQGLDRFVARQAILADLKALDLIEKIEPHVLKIPRGDRTNEIIEPFLTDQWFVKATELGKAAVEAVETGLIQFVPETWEKTYFQWMHHLEDWCISRQLWWGHRIPAWYDEAGQIYVGENEEAVRQHYQLDKTVMLMQDNDVLDTWFSSAFWPFVTLGWPDKQDTFDTFYPTQVLVTGFDIIFFWVARMIMMGLKITKKIPFHQVYVTGLIRDSEGQKMSKSKGNILDPIDLCDGVTLEALIEKRTHGLMQNHLKEKIIKQTKNQFPEGISAYGTDALRFTFYSLATMGRDIRFELTRIESHRNFCNKIWNAARYVMMMCEGQHCTYDENTPLALPDRFILSRLQNTIATVHRHFQQYRFDLLSQALYDFIWHDYCDWYVELSKSILQNDVSVAEKANTRYVLLSVLEAALRLCHPLIPFITEDIWQRLSPLLGLKGQTIMTQDFPEMDEAHIDLACEIEIEWLKKMILAIRNIRGEMNISPSLPLKVLLRKGDETDKVCLKRHLKLLSHIARLESMTWLLEDEQAPPAATAFNGALEILIPLAGLIDLEAEKQRLEKALEKIEKELLRAQEKLNNPSYIQKAPVQVVEQERQRVEGWILSKTKMIAQIEKLKTL
jgi:valyl-tRNA synthetase